MSRSAGGEPIDILLVEDNPGDVRLTKEAFEDAGVTNEFHVVSRGDDALDYLNQRGEYGDASAPDIVLLDLNLPGMDGREVLEEVKDSPALKHIPVVVLTGSSEETDIARGYESHANAYLTKPVDGAEFLNLVRSIGEFWIEVVELPPHDG